MRQGRTKAGMMVAAGIYVVIASGRTDNAILNFVRRLDIAGFEQGRYMIAQNGASISDLHARKTIYEHHVDTDVLLGAYKVASEEGLHEANSLIP